MGYVSETSANDDVGAERGLSVASSSDSDCPIQAVEGQQEHSDGDPTDRLRHSFQLCFYVVCGLQDVCRVIALVNAHPLRGTLG